MNQIDKKALRKEMSKIRGHITSEQALLAEERCIHFLRESDIYKEYQWFYPYISYRSEFPTHKLIEQLLADGKCVAVPKVEGDIMKFYEIHSLDDCAPGCMGILEPVDDQMESVEDGVVLLPGLAFDERGGRMGYGAGYYDKYLSIHKKHRKIALAFDCQVIDEVPMEEHDLPMEYLLTAQAGLKRIL
ncbi:MAG: 5-formyltetrahydrofolate cyclo-ligase [Eubacteriales bacterium]|nr:5-formyltetrahydrofolate cyclo-ligase [Eubacteriales bacterium]